VILDSFYARYFLLSAYIPSALKSSSLRIGILDVGRSEYRRTTKLCQCSNQEKWAFPEFRETVTRRSLLLLSSLA